MIEYILRFNYIKVPVKTSLQTVILRLMSLLVNTCQFMCFDSSDASFYIGYYYDDKGLIFTFRFHIRFAQGIHSFVYPI